MVIIILGSKSDLETGKAIGKYLDKFDIEYAIRIGSAHKTPEYVMHFIDTYDEKFEPLVYITVAGRSNALGGFVDAHTQNPVINCPPQGTAYAGFDILSSLRMPSGIASLTVLEPEAAALSAAKILSCKTRDLKKKIESYQKSFKDKTIQDDKKLI